MPQTFEGDPFSQSDKAKATIDGLREKLASQTPEEKAASFEAGLDLMLADYKADPGFFDRQQARVDNDPTIIAEREQSEELYRVRRELGYGALGYNPNIKTQRQRARMDPTAEEIAADQMAADLAYSASRPRPQPSDFRS